VSSTLIPEINDFMLGLRRVIVGVLVSSSSSPPPLPPRAPLSRSRPAVSAGRFIQRRRFVRKETALKRATHTHTHTHTEREAPYVAFSGR